MVKFNTYIFVWKIKKKNIFPLYVSNDEEFDGKKLSFVQNYKTCSKMKLFSDDNVNLNSPRFFDSSL